MKSVSFKNLVLFIKGEMFEQIGTEMRRSGGNGNNSVGIGWNSNSKRHSRTAIIKKGKGSPYSITERRVPELIQILGSQPAGDVSYKPGGRLPLLSARPAVSPQPLSGLLLILLLGEQRHNGCEQFAQTVCYPTASRLRFEPGPFCA